MKTNNTDYPNRSNGYQGWITDLQLIATDAPSGPKIMTACLEMMEMLIKKNVSYGDSAISPVRIFAQSDSIEQIKIRIDDKINRVKNNQGFAGDNDIDDLIGYLILLKIAIDKNRPKEV
jgi:hypothetical protein